MNAAEKKRKNRFKMRMIKIGVVSGILIPVVGLGILGWSLVSKYIGDPARNEINTDTVIVDMSDPHGNTDYGLLYYTPIDEEHIVSADGENSVMYIDNEVLVVVTDGTTRDEVVALSEKYNAEIVGEIEITGDYQLRLSEDQTEDGLSQIVDDLNSESIVETALLNYVMPITESKKTEERDGFYYGEKWYKDLQNFNNAKGKSWGLEAIGALGAWDKLTHTSRTINPVKVGVIDNGFDVDHEDLQFAEVFYDNGSNGLYAPTSDHGTHVCGTIAAKNNDTIGICGIYPYGEGNLYGVAHGGNTKYGGVNKYSENGDFWTSVMSMKIAYSELIVRNVKVINQSQGFNYYTYDYFKKKTMFGEKTDYDLLKTYWNDSSNFAGYIETSKAFGDFLNRMLQKGYDFVIISAAGNDSDKSIGHLDCRYSSWNNMIRYEDYPDVYDRIIVVGSVNSKMEIADYSNGGDRVDIYAPGDSIYSTIPNNKYGNKSGTSMAAPHVAGVAAMVWSANNSLTGAEVKEAITRRSNSRCTSCKMVDAYTAVEYALGEDETGGTTNVENGGVLCYVVDRNNENIKITGATVSMKNVDTGEIYTTETDELGHFEIVLPEGKYTLTVTADGYEDYEWPDGNNYQNPIIVKNEGINYLDDWIKMKKIGKEEIQLSVFALDADDLSPITNKEIEITLGSQELNCTNSKQTISTTDGSVIFNISMGEKNRVVNSKITLHIDGYKDYVLENFSFGNDPVSVNMFEAYFEKNEDNDPTAGTDSSPSNSNDIFDDEDEFFEYLEDDYEDYDYGVPLEDVIAWTYHNGHLYALFDYAVSARIMNLVTLADPSVHLVTINDANEQAAVEELIAAGGRDIYYTGGLVDKNGSLYWINGETVNYSNWYDGCPEYYNEEGYDDVVVIYRGAESPAENDPDFGVWIEVLEDDYSYLDFFDFDIDGITRGIVIEWDNPSEYGLAE